MQKNTLFVILTICALCVHQVCCFDTGHHYDLLQSSLSYYGFSDHTIKIMQVLNWMVDFYSFGTLGKTVKHLQLLHMDTLRNTSEVACYWHRFSRNMRNATHEVTKEKDVFKMVSLLAISLHTLQDFYTHSNWVETHPRNGTCGCYRTDTWFVYSHENISTLPNIFSDSCDMCGTVEDRNRDDMIPHGSYCYGINKDSEVRPNWEEAYVFAYVASLEWINATMTWSLEIDPEFWSKVLNYKDLDYARDLDAAYKISLWVLTGPENDGHWKGSGSGSGLRGLVKWLVWSIIPDSKLLKKFKSDKSYLLLTERDPYDVCDSSKLVNDPIVAPFSRDALANFKAVVVRTLEIERWENRNLAKKMLTFNYNDTGTVQTALFAKITINGQEFVEPTQKNLQRPFWTSIMFVNTSTVGEHDPKVNITYELWEEKPWTKNTRLDINSAKNYSKSEGVSMTYYINSHEVEGDINGVFDTSERPAFTKGTVSSVQFYIHSVSLTGCPRTTYFGPIDHGGAGPQCENTAFAEQGKPFVCTPKGAAYTSKQFRNTIIALSMPFGYLILGCMLGCVILMWRKCRQNRKPFDWRIFMDPRNRSNRSNRSPPPVYSEANPLLTGSEANPLLAGDAQPNYRSL